MSGTMCPYKISNCGAQTSRRLMLRMYMRISFSKFSLQCNLF